MDKFYCQKCQKTFEAKGEKKNGKARFMEFVGRRSLNALFARVRLKKLKR